MTEKELIVFYKKQLDWYKSQLDWSDQHLLFLHREMKKREKYNMDRQQIRKNMEKYEKLLSEMEAQ